MRVESILTDMRYGVRRHLRSPVFSGGVAATIGLGLGVLCSAFTVLNAYVLTPIDLPNPRELYELGWDTATIKRRPFSLADFEAVRESARDFSDLAASADVAAMDDGTAIRGMLVTGNYFGLLGGTPEAGRFLGPSDEAGAVVLSHVAWQSRFGGDPAVVGSQIRLGRTTVAVVGVAPPHYGIPGHETAAFWAPLTMAPAFGLPSLDATPDRGALEVIGRLRPDSTEAQARAWLGLWLQQRFADTPDTAPVAARVESRATRIQLTGTTLTMFVLILAAFALVLFVACANVVNLMLAHGFSRQREITVRLSLGAARSHLVRQMSIEGLLLAAPAAALGLAITFIAARVFPALIAATFPAGIAPIESLLMPVDPDARVLALLSVSAIVSTVLVNLVPAMRVTHAALAAAPRGHAGAHLRSRLRTALVVVQVGACVLFLAGAAGLVAESWRIAHPDVGLGYERVADVRVAPALRADLAARLRRDPAVEQVAATWQPPLSGPLRRLDVRTSSTRVAESVGFMAVSPDYFSLFDIDIVRGRNFTAAEIDAHVPVALVSAATARLLWPGLDPLGRTLELLPARGGSQRLPAHTRVEIIGVTRDVTSGLITEGTDPACVYFGASFEDGGDVAILVRARRDLAASRAAVTTAMSAIAPDAPFQFFGFTQLLGGQAWLFQAFSAAASVLGTIGLLLAFTGTYAVVAFLVGQRTREFGVRMALGATSRQIVAMILGQALKTAAVGIAAGLAMTFALVQAAGGASEIVPRFGPAPYLLAFTIAAVSTAAAALAPSLRASRVDPSSSLRAE